MLLTRVFALIGAVVSGLSFAIVVRYVLWKLSPTGSPASAHRR